MIKPTIGRVVWFWPKEPIAENFSFHGGQPCSAQVVYVHNDNCVNLQVLDHSGCSFGFTSVPLIQEGESPPAFGPYCEWMPYQIGQAKKA